MNRILRNCGFACCLATVAMYGERFGVFADPPGDPDEQVKNAKCVTMLNPARCDTYGAAFCNAVAEGGNCAGDCVFCNTTSALPSKLCMPWQNSTCKKLIGPPQDLACPDNANGYKGVCDIPRGSSCTCTNPQLNGSCSAVSVTVPIEC